MRRALWLSVLLGVGSCTTPKTLAWQWAEFEPEVLARATQHDDAVAVVLLSDQRFVFQNQGSREGRTEVHFHTVHKLLTEAGLNALSFTMPWPKKGRLLHLDARSIAPDGSITPVTDREMFSDEVSYGKDEKGQAVGENLRRFAFPQVEVGSLLEVAWAFEMPGLYTSWSNTVMGDLPIEKYRVEIVVDQATTPDFMVVNGAYPPRLVDHHDGMQHMVLELEHLPAQKSEALAPSPRQSEPWWIYRAVAVRQGATVYAINDDWTASLRGLGKVLVKNKGAEGAVLQGRAKCEGKPDCLIDAALVQLRSLPWSGHDGSAFDWRGIKEIEAAASASSSEKALYLWALLSSAGVDAKVAGLARAHTVEVDQSFPALTWLNHTLVVARVDGADVWLDPSCEHCGRGEVPSWSLGRSAVVASPGDEKVTADWRVVTGAPPRVANERRVNWAMQVDADGGLDAALVWSAAGEDAGVACRVTRDWAADDWREMAVDGARAVSPVAHVVGFTPGECDRTRGTYRRTLRLSVPSWSGRGSDGALVVPLPDFGGLDVTSRETRKQDVVVAAPQSWVHEARITPPSGYIFGAVPKSQTHQVGGNTLRVEVNREGDALLLRRTLTLAAGLTPLASASPLLTLARTSKDLEHATLTLIPAPKP